MVKKEREDFPNLDLQLREKQKAKTTYGFMEKQFKNLVQTVQIKRGDTKELIVSALETRLDNVVYRLGFAKTQIYGKTNRFTRTRFG